MKFLLYLAVVILVLKVEALGKPLVQTTYGILQGIEEETTTLRKKLFVFLGVPYAKPPIGKLRFEEPHPVKKWTGIWQATESSSACLQHMLNYDKPDLIIGEEDCLYINIYTPTLSVDSQLPVLVFFHGGAFMYGTGNIFTPHFILDRGDFVYISVNYRLGPMGFLSTEDGVVSGNMGLKDQVMALKWVQENIAVFGGNKNEVTIAGISAGGASVHLHFLSPMSKNLFKRGISMSGSALSPWVLAEKSSDKAKLLASAVGCATNDTHLMIKCLKHRPGRKVLSQLKSLFWPWGTLPFSPFGVVIETASNKPFLNEHPLKLISEGRVSDLPWLTSLTREEGLYPSAAFIDREELLQELNENWNTIIPHVLDYNYTISPENLDSVSSNIRKFYFEDEKISVNNRDNIIEMVGDRLFNVDVIRAALLQASVTTSPIYFYLFAYEGKYSISLFLSKHNETYGVSHADDLIYILNRPILTPLETIEDKNIMIKMTNIWLSFILTGVPSPKENIQWNPVEKSSDINRNLTYLYIGNNEEIFQVSLTPNALSKSNFWNSLSFNELQITPESNTSNKKQSKDEL